MRAAAIAFLHSQVQAAVPPAADFYDGAKMVDLQERLTARRAWVKLYMPSEEGDSLPLENYIVTIDCGAVDMESARAVAEAVRGGLKGDRRNPSPFKRRRIAAMNEGNYSRVQITYIVTRPAH